MTLSTRSWTREAGALISAGGVRPMDSSRSVKRWPESCGGLREFGRFGGRVNAGDSVGFLGRSPFSPPSVDDVARVSVVNHSGARDYVERAIESLVATAIEERLGGVQRLFFTGTRSNSDSTYDQDLARSFNLSGQRRARTRRERDDYARGYPVL